MVDHVEARIDPNSAASTSFTPGEASSGTCMPYTCQTCAKRKVRCDKAAPACSGCRKNKFECSYRAPPQRKRRRLIKALDVKLAQYEEILSQHGLLPQDAEPLTAEAPQEAGPSPAKAPKSSQEPVSLNFLHTDLTSRVGKLTIGQGRSRYIDSNIWRTLGDDELQYFSDSEDDEDAVATNVAMGDLSDPLTGAFMGSQQSLFDYHPTCADAMALWRTHIDNVEPICKVLHIPSTAEMVQRVSKQPATASRAEECLLFAMYHFAVFSMSKEQCAKYFGQPKTVPLRRYNYAARQALVNASFLKTTEMPIMQALILFLLPGRYLYDPHTYWILTGVAVRIAQRMGLHRDGEKLGLPPFEVQMRRRLFYQLIPLDGIASQMSGVGIGMMPGDWDTQPPSNINDDQIWPGMIDPPIEQKGATDMIFCLTRACVGKYFARTGSAKFGGAEFNDYTDVERVVREAEDEVENKFIRYCDILNPLHAMSICLARSAISAMRLRVRMPKVKKDTVSEAERKEMYQIACRILDTDAAAYANTSMRKYLWHGQNFFAWGSWDALIFILTSMRSSDLNSGIDLALGWERIEQAYTNHGSLLTPKQPLHVAVGQLVVKIWDATHQNSNVLEPTFIAALRRPSKTVPRVLPDVQEHDMSALGPAGDAAFPLYQCAANNNATATFDVSLEGTDLNIGNELNFDAADWVFWDKLIHDYQTQGSQQQYESSQRLLLP